MSGKIAGAVWDLDLPRPEMFILLALADHADHEGKNAHPGLELLAWKTGYDESQVKRLLKSLRDKELIRPQEEDRVGGRGNMTCWEIHLEKGTQKPARKGAHGAQERGASHANQPEKGAHGAQERGAFSGETEKKERKEPKERKKETRTVIEPGKDKTTPDARRVPFRDFMFEKLRSVGVDPDTDPSDWKVFEKFLTRTRDKPAFTLEKLQEYFNAFVHSEDKYDQKQGRPIRFFCSNVNRFMRQVNAKNRSTSPGTTNTRFRGEPEFRPKQD